MRKLISVVLRNFKLLIRSKTSGLIFILGPLLLIFLVGLAFNTSSPYAINLGVYTPDDSILAQSFIEELRVSKISVTEFPREDECIQSVRWGASHMCMVFPKDFVIRNDKTNEITFYADTSQANLVYMVLDAVGDEISTTSTELTAGLTEIILSAISKTRQTLENDTALLTQQGAIRTKTLIQDEEAKSTLKKLKLDTPDSGFEQLDGGVDDFDNYITSLNSAADDAVTELKDLINKVEDNAEDIIADIEDLNPSGQMSIDDAEAILSFINDSGEALGDIEERLNRAQDNATDAIDDIDDLIGDVGKNFDRAAERLEAAYEGRSDVLDNLNEIVELINQSETLATQIQNNHKTLLATLDAIPITSAQSIAKPITTKIEPVSTEKSNLSYMYPSLIMLVLMFICLLLSSTLVIMERKSLATFRNFCTPTRDISFTIGTYITTLSVVLMQLVIIISISAFVFKAAFVSNIGTLSILLFLLSSLFIFLGMAIGNFFSTEETVTLASISIGSLFLMLSDLILPLESMPNQVAAIAEFNPFVLGSDLLKQIMLFDFTFVQLSMSLFMLIGYCIAIFVLAVLIQKLMKWRFLRFYTRFNVKKKDALKEVKLKLEPTEGIVVEKTTIKSMGELSKHIKKMKKESYSEYVSEHKNRFADWVRNAYDDPVLAGKMAKQINQRRQVSLLRRAQKERDREKKKEDKKK